MPAIIDWVYIFAGMALSYRYSTTDQIMGVIVFDKAGGELYFLRNEHSFRKYG